MRKKVTITAPDSLREIQLQQYQKLLKIEEPTEQDIVKIMFNFNEELLRAIPYTEITKLSNIILDLLKKEQRFKSLFILDGKKYGFIPKLDDISWGEYDDLMKYIQDMDSMHKAMAVMFRPVTLERKGKYLIEDYDGSKKYSEVMKKAPLDVVMGAMVFFYDLANELLKAIPNYLRGEVSQNPSLENGGRITSYLHLLEEIVAKWNPLQRLDFTKHYTTLPTSQTTQNTKNNKSKRDEQILPNT